MTRKILITATKWSGDRHKILRSALTSATEKYGDNLTIHVGYTAPSLIIAKIARELGINVRMYAPDFRSGVTPKTLTLADNIQVLSLTKSKYMGVLVSESDAVMAFDKGDPVVFNAVRQDKKVWYPTN